MWLFNKFPISIIIVFSIQLVVRLFLTREMVGMSIRKYFNNVILKAALVTIVSFAGTFLIYNISDESLLRFVIVVCAGLLFTGLSILLTGLSKDERLFFYGQATSFIKRIKPHHNN